MNSLKGCLSEFTRIHQSWLKFNQQLVLEKVRLENKKKLIEFKHNLYSGEDKTDHKPIELVETSSAELIEYLNWKKQQKAIEDERHSKI